MALHKVFSRHSIQATGVVGAPARRSAYALATGSGGAVGAVLVGGAAGLLFGPVGAWCGLVVGALVGAIAGKRIAQPADDAREDTYWRERPYVDTGFGALDVDLDQAPAPGHKFHRQARAGGLGDIAAHPTSDRNRGLRWSGSGREGAPNWMRDSRRSLGDLAASRSL